MLRSLFKTKVRITSVHKSLVVDGRYLDGKHVSFPLRRLSIFEKFPAKAGLYDKALEKDSCGVGLVAQLKKKANRQIILDANEMLVRMSHRGACGCEENSGDGAGNALNSQSMLC